VQFFQVPVNFHFKYSPDVPKREEVVAVGRWDSFQKRTPLLTATISQVLAHRPSIRFRIFGRITPELENWHRQLALNLQNQVILEGFVPNSSLIEAYQHARAMLVSAAYEGCHNSSAEAVCCGASIVGCRSPFLSALEWHVAKNSGRLAERATPESLAQTLLDEMATWDRGERDPVAMSEAWTSELHPDRVATRILNFFGETAPHKAL
jgi:glycogen synthase